MANSTQQLREITSALNDLKTVAPQAGSSLDQLGVKIDKAVSESDIKSIDRYVSALSKTERVLSGGKVGGAISNITKDLKATSGQLDIVLQKLGQFKASLKGLGGPAQGQAFGRFGASMQRMGATPQQYAQLVARTQMQGRISSGDIRGQGASAQKASGLFQSLLQRGVITQPTRGVAEGQFAGTGSLPLKVQAQVKKEIAELTAKTQRQLALLRKVHQDVIRQSSISLKTVQTSLRGLGVSSQQLPGQSARISAQLRSAGVRRGTGFQPQPGTSIEAGGFQVPSTTALGAGAQAGGKGPQNIDALRSVLQQVASNTARTATNTQATGAAGRSVPPTGRQIPVTGGRQGQLEQDLGQAEQMRKLTTKGIPELFPSNTTAKVKAFERQLGGLGIKMQDVTGISKDLVSGVSTIGFKTTSAGGALKTASFNVDKFGRVATKTTNTFKSMGQSILNNATKALTWAVAIGVVYGSLSRLSQLLGMMKEIEDAMARIQVTSQKAGEDLRQLFDGVIKVADDIGVDAVQSLESFNFALKAVGGSANDVERAAAATQLLTDASILSRIAGMDQKEAMDTLLASLRQTNRGIEDSTLFLNKFQRVANSAGTSVEDMAKTFANVSGAAANVKVDVDQLNGLIAGLAESTTLDSIKINNSLRAMFSNFTTDTAQSALRQYGIAVEDLSTGELKGFIDIMDRINQLSQAGVLDADAMTNITNAIGGGSRRSAQVAALLNNWERIQELQNISGGASATSGEAEEALTTISDTLSVSVERLENSFVNFAESLGEAGVLDILDNTVQLLTGLVNIVADLVDFLGPATTALLAFGAAMTIKSSFGPQIGAFLSGGRGAAAAGAGAGGSQIDAFNQGGGGAVASRMPIMLQKSVKDFKTGMVSTVGTFATRFAPTVITSLVQGLQGNTGGAIGTAIGGLFVGAVTNNPLWQLAGGVVGAKAAELIISAIQQIQEDRGVIETIRETGVPEFDPKEGDRGEFIQKRIEEFNAFARTALPKENLVGQEADQVLKDLLDTKAKIDETLGSEALQKSLSIEFLNPEELEEVLASPGIEIDRRIAALNAIRDELEGIVDISSHQFQLFTTTDIKDLETAEQILNSILETAEAVQTVGSIAPEGIDLANAPTESLFENTAKFKEKYKRLFRELSLEAQAALITDVGEPTAQGGITGAEFRRRQANADIATTSIPFIFTALGDESAKFEDKIDSLFSAIIDAPTEQTSFLNTLAADAIDAQVAMEELATQLNEIKTGTVGIPEGTSVADLEAALNTEEENYDRRLATLISFLNRYEAEINRGSFSFKGFVETEDFSASEITNAIQEAAALQEVYSQDLGFNLTDLTQTAETFFVKYADGFRSVDGVQQAFFNSALNDIKEFKKELQDTFNFKDLRDLPIEAAEKLQKGINFYTQLLAQYGFNEQNELITVLFQDNQVGQLVGSQTALRLAMEDNTEQLKKQLEGVYNLPSGATAFVPISSMFYNRDRDGGGGGGFPDYPSAPALAPGTFPQGAETPTTTRITREQEPPDTNLDRRLSDLVLDSYQRAAEQSLSIYEAQRDFIPGTEGTDQFKFFGEGGFPEAAGPPDAFDAPTAPGAEGEVEAADVFDIFKGILNLISGRGISEESQETSPILRLITNQFNKFSTILGQFGDATSQGKIPGSELTGAGGEFTGTEAFNTTIINPAPVNVTVTPEQVKHEFLANIVLEVSGRILANAIKPFLFEDFQRISASVGSNQRQANIIA